MSDARGFSLIETIVYLALFSIMIGGIVSAAYVLFASAHRSQAQALLHGEKDFLIQKIDTALSGASVISTSTPQTITSTHYGGAISQICLSGTDLRYLAQSGSCASTGTVLNNADVAISNLIIVHSWSSTNPILPDTIEVGFMLRTKTTEGQFISGYASTTAFIRI